MKRFLAGVLVSASLLTAGGHIKNVELEMPVVQKSKGSIFFDLGFSKYNVSSKSNIGTFTKGALDDKGVILGVGYAYSLKNNLFTEVGYEYSKLDIAKVHNVYASLNYQFNKTLSPYVGVVLGYSKLKWSKEPYTSYVNAKLDSSSLLYGVQAGISYKVSEKLSVTAKYQLLKFSHKMNIQNGQAEIKHKLQNNLLIGARYEF